MRRFEYYTLNNSGNVERSTKADFEYFVKEYGIFRNDDEGNTYDLRRTNIRKLPIKETVQAYNAQGYLIAEKVEL